MIILSSLHTGKSYNTAQSAEILCHIEQYKRDWGILNPYLHFVTISINLLSGILLCYDLYKYWSNLCQD